MKYQYVPLKSAFIEAGPPYTTEKVLLGRRHGWGVYLGIGVSKSGI
jgi:hypothetical protein